MKENNINFRFNSSSHTTNRITVSDRIFLATRAILLLFLFTSLNSFSQSKTGYSLVWEDNFNGSSLDTSNWSNEVARPGWVNNELQRYTNGDNVLVSNGELQLIAKNENKEYTSARIITKGKRIFTYGLVEIKAKIPRGTGTWPALWMLGENISEVGWPVCGELDIMEHVGKHPDFIHSTVHNKSAYGSTPNTGIMEIKNPFDEFHIYGMEWTKEFISFYIDGNLVYKYNPAVKNQDTWPFDKPFFLIFNIAIGGDWGGPDVDEKLFPAIMTVDWVKVYQMENKNK
jgi:beta-glucanase (GH16 family)